ncbi:MAG: hypothetical protein EXR71_03170 [Myxococcales bacterium]|nr:hypothetical protein [Myxococcales bacterium]
MIRPLTTVLCVRHGWRGDAVVQMTARVQRYERARPRHGVPGVIAKPFDSVSLPNRLGTIWARAAAD